MHQDVGRLSEDQVGLALRMTSFKQQVCRCGEGSGRLSDVSYEEPPVASGSGLSFRDGGSPSPIPVPPPASQVQGPDVPLPSSGSSSSDKENSSLGSYQSAPQGVSELVEIVDADPRGGLWSCRSSGQLDCLLFSSCLRNGLSVVVLALCWLRHGFEYTRF